MNSNIKKFTILLSVFLAAYFLPANSPRVQGAVVEAFAMLHEYAREHVLFCLIPAFFIAGAIAVFVSQASVMKYFGPKANKLLSYSVASVSGTILAVCSCTVLPLFAGIYSRGAGLGPASAFLYSGPAINVLAIILTARILGFEMGLARAVGAIGFAFMIGLIMHVLFLKEEREKIKQAEDIFLGEVEEARPLWKTGSYFAVMVGVLVFANWGKPIVEGGAWAAIYHSKWMVTAVLVGGLGTMLTGWFKKDELKEWTSTTWGFALQILPLLFGGVLVAGFALGRPGHEGLIPSSWIATLVGGNSLFANFFAALSGALMYFATLTEVPILQGLMGSGMGKGPALALLLAGPSLSLPSMLVINRVLGPKKTIAYASTVVIMATIAGLIYGRITS
ncbi:MAG TPA: permease [Armatimonadota bacterium]|nr:permease [Armatimonadota bacterium]